MIEFEGEICSAGAQDREERDHGLDRTGDRQCNNSFCFDAVLRKHLRDTVYLAVELGVGETRVAVDECVGVGDHRSALGEQSRHRGVG